MIVVWCIKCLRSIGYHEDGQPEYDYPIYKVEPNKKIGYVVCTRCRNEQLLDTCQIPFLLREVVLAN